MERLKDFDIVRSSKGFNYLYGRSKKYYGEFVIVFFKESEQKSVGFTASKKIGNAVQRNKAKRRLRAIFIEIAEKLKVGSYIFVAKSSINGAEYKNIKESTLSCLKKLNSLN